ncbi:MAG TPA: AAA family ATPase [Ktedonobacteraceae bacterium]|nr:AAA family ATPase [Ktedonobacteraceae bacterium]
MINAAPAQLTIRLLGTPEALLAGTPLLLHDQKARALLYYLAAVGRPRSRDYLASLLWSESLESNARHSLRSSLYHMRQALQARGAGDVLAGEGDTICLKLADDACDVAHFRRVLEHGSANTIDSVPHLEQAVALYRGPLLQGFSVSDAPLFEEWVRAEDLALQQGYLDALQRLVALAESRGAWDEAIVYAQCIVQADPLFEPAQQRLIQLYLRAGAIGQALRQYRQFEAVLQQESSIMPSPETWAAITSAMEARRSAKREGGARLMASAPFAGRAEELKKLRSLAQLAASGQGMTVVAQGENGIGKSRLLDELVSILSTSSKPWLILQGSCSPFDDLLSYGPFLDAFQNANAGDLTDVLADARGSSADEQGRFEWRVLQALRTLTRDAPLLLAIDDLQWANSTTLHLFGFLATRLRSLPVMLVGTVQRVEAVPALQRLVTLGRRRGDAHTIALSPLTQEDVHMFLASLGISLSSAPSLVEWLYEQSAGSPFILKEIIAQLRAEAILYAPDIAEHKTSEKRHELRLDSGRWLRWRSTCSLPETTHDLVTWRLENLSSIARSLLDILAVANQPLPLALLRDVSGLSEEQLLPVAEDLVASGLVVESGNDMFALPHQLLREALMLPLSHLRQRAIHRQLATRLDACPALQKNFPLRQIALHAVIGEDVERARRYGLQVLDELARDNANTQTLDFLHHLYDLLAPSASLEELLRLARALGQTHQTLGQLDEAATWYEHEREYAQELGDAIAQVAAHFAAGELALVANNYDDAAQAASKGLDLSASLRDGQHISLMARGHRLLGAALAMEGSDLPAAEHHLQEAVAAHRLSDNQEDLCAVLFELGNVAAQRGEITRALNLYEAAAKAAESAHIYYFQALAYNNLAYHHLLPGNIEAAQKALSKGYALAESHEMFGALLHLTSTRGEISLYLHEWTEAWATFQHGLTLAEELNNLERQAGFRAGLALAARGQGRLDDATRLLEEALLLISERGYWHLRTRLQLWLAETLLLAGQRSEAEVHLNAALTTAREHGRAHLLAQAEELMASL